MSFARSFVKRVSKRARQKRGELFTSQFHLTPQTKILDLGSENGSHIHAVLQGTAVLPENVYIADIYEKFVLEGQERFGFQPVVIPETGQLPFPDQFFDVVFCSSVIEHVTVAKEEVWQLASGRAFKRRALARQTEFAQEVARLGKGYYVQTPYKWFLLESHTLLPFAGYLPRRILIPIMRLSNKIWIKNTSPDWYLLNKREMASMFPDASIISERLLGGTKSIMAVRSNK